MTKNSDFFRAARSLLWTSKTKPTELPEQKPWIFALYLDCLYDRTMPKTPTPAQLSNDKTDDNSSDDGVFYERDSKSEYGNNVFIGTHWKKLVGLYVLACYLMDPTTRNMTIDQIRRFYYEIRRYNYRLNNEVINLVFRSTQDGDTLRNLLADFFGFEAERTHSNSPKEWFVLLWQMSLSLRVDGDLAVKEEALARFRRIPGPEGWDDEYYHDVEEDQ